MDRKCIIFGTGGAARAVAVGLKRSGAGSILLVSRDPDNANPACKKYGDVIAYDEVRKHTDAQIIINAAPVGNIDTIDETILSLADVSAVAFHELELAIDLIYNPVRTKFLQDARRLTGCKTASGLEMLIHQGIEARNIWKSAAYVPHFENIATSAIKRQILTTQLNIVAVGMPGSGKTSIFRRYAYEMGLEFFDTDKMTEELMERSITEVLEAGEIDYFREMEQKAIIEACKHTHAVIATGGGAILNPVSRDVLRSNGVVIYVRRPIEKLSMKGRPLSEMIGTKELFDQRDRIYNRVADISIKNEITFGETLDKKGNKNSYSYDMKRFVFGVKKEIEQHIFKIAGNKWT